MILSLFGLNDAQVALWAVNGLLTVVCFLLVYLMRGARDDLASRIKGCEKNIKQSDAQWRGDLREHIAREDRILDKIDRNVESLREKCEVIHNTLLEYQVTASKEYVTKDTMARHEQKMDQLAASVACPAAAHGTNK